VIATVLGTGNLQIVRIDLKNGRAEPMGIEGLGVRYSVTGHLLYSTADASVMVAPFSSRSARLTGPPVQLRGGLSIREGSAPFAVSAEGTLVGLFGGLARRRLATVDLHGATRFLSDEERLFAWPAVSPDGQRVAMEIADSFGGPWDVWVLDLRSSTLSRLTHGGTGIRPAGWTADGRKVVFIGLRTANDLFASTPRVIVAAPWGGGQSGKLDTLFRGNVMEASIAGRYLVASVGVIGHTNLWLAPLDTPSAGRMLSGSQANESSPEVSPDGRWLAYASDESGRWEVYVAPLPGPGGRVQASANGGIQPRWGRDGASLFYRDAEHLLRATLATSAEPELRVVKRETLFEDHFFRGNTATSAYDAFPGGRELLMLSLTSSHAQVTVLMNWPAMLERRSTP
jgi:dipeptidyl aminopeptidase/acylaminoacyl peptidase